MNPPLLRLTGSPSTGQPAAAATSHKWLLHIIRLCEAFHKRKNYLFAGSHDAARRIAAIYSILRTCAQQGVPPLPYLTDVLRKLANGWDQNRLEELLPDRWQLLHSAGNNSRLPAPELLTAATASV